MVYNPQLMVHPVLKVEEGLLRQATVPAFFEVDPMADFRAACCHLRWAAMAWPRVPRKLSLNDRSGSHVRLILQYAERYKDAY